MANCSICGKSCGLMSGGKEPYTGNNLFVCKNAGLYLNVWIQLKRSQTKKISLLQKTL